MAVRFPRVVFTIAGIWGVLIMTPLYFTFDAIGRAYPPPLTHPDVYYGFVGVTLVWQVAFLVIASDPVRHRTFMLTAVLEKLLYVGTMIALLYWRGQGIAVLQGLRRSACPTGCSDCCSWWRSSRRLRSPACDTAPRGVEWLILTDSATDRVPYAVPQAMLIVVGVLAVFWRALTFPFVQDDWQFVYDFAHVGPWTVALAAFDPVGKLFYRPIGVLYFASLYQLFGLHVAGYHVVALAIHCVNCLLVGKVVSALTGRWDVGVATALVLWLLRDGARDAACLGRRRHYISLATLFGLLAVVLLSRG